MRVHLLIAIGAPLLACFAAKQILLFWGCSPNSIYFLFILIFVFCYGIVLILTSSHVIGTQRLNDYFVAMRFPFSKWHFISQSINKKHIEGMTCKQIAHDFSKQAVTVFENLKPDRTYLASTHQTVIRRLKENPDIHMLTEALDYHSNMQKTQRRFLNRKCTKNCTVAEQNACFLQKSVAKKRSFYFIKFTVAPK